MTAETAAVDARPVASSQRVGVLLVNLGTPDALGYWPVRRYLKEFLSDRRVVNTPRLIWWPILNLIILTTRPQRSSKNYETIWNSQRNESPLKTVTRSQAEQLAGSIVSGEFGAGGDIVVDWAMRYANPSILSSLQRLREQGCGRVLIVPLYPQFAGATTLSVADKVEESLARMNWRPDMRSVPPYYNDPVYIDALAQSVRAGLAALDFEPEVVLVSFHGIPKSYVEAGDPYYDQCVETWRLLRERLDFSPERCPLTFQSRFGRAEWLSPYTDETVKELARKGVRRMAVLTPGFSVDCLETISEIGVENREFFIEAGGEQFALIPCLNDSALGMKVIRHIVSRELEGWI
ncbi:Ferrochelatase [Methylocella silvestris BL2]|uniref:Ferrochelatase n=1 Tax=Methylocella silvestris (strain DSM 15510 / CIP 108128 / LMG 27833 / NCIMB 13906 / BL2) TaxID=395965 RepID=HEMH_METSB|nr:ferrochelatase [Methylocella silvestris]B8EJ84.1 RecName: Full=Ferrochelatase; AltName: Full=Heme synthase; AltName: Full=Protoheme ferro-lyase [Methylocella silvestris BL2]ACK52576.1 Ferrochelatase [Methylocella silvestris BL2]